MTDGDPTPELRVGDRERRATDDRLRAAMDDGMLTLVEYDERTAQCWAARTRRELDVLVADLPADAGPRPAPTIHADADAAATPAVRAPREPLRARLGKLVVPLVALGVVVYGGVNVLGAADGAAVFGSRTVPVAASQGEVEVASLFGSTEVVVPDGALVRTTGLMIFGSTDCEEACRTPPGAPSQQPIVVDARGGFGSVDVVTQSEAARGGIDQDGDDDDD